MAASMESFHFVLENLFCTKSAKIEKKTVKDTNIPKMEHTFVFDWN